jgi:hypothetical protein
MCLPLFQDSVYCEQSQRQQKGGGEGGQADDGGQNVELVTRSLHNITDVIFGIRYPVSATDTI